MMDIADIREFARHQHLRGVEVVEIKEDQRLVRIRIAAARPLQDGAAPATVPSTEAPRPKDLTARSEALGLLRRSHPVRLPTAIEVGDAVDEGQLLALLELGDTLTAVNAPGRGIVESVLADEGQRIDYGMSLFQLTPASR